MGNITGSTSGGSGGAKPATPKTKWFPDFVKSEIPELTGKVIVITGTTSGTGMVLAKTAVSKHVDTILLLNRSSDRATAAEAEIKAAIPAGTTCHVESIACDLQNLASVREAASLILAKYPAVDVLINNAGVMAIDDIATKDGFDVQMQTNHLSHFLLTQQLFPLLKRAAELRGEARVVTHSSSARAGTKCIDAKYYEKNGGNLGGNKAGFMTGPPWDRYAQSKLANSLFAYELSKKCAALAAAGGPKIKSVVCVPGFASTSLATNSGAVPMFMMRFAQSGEDGTMPLLKSSFGTDVENGDFFQPRGTLRQNGIPQKYPIEEKNTKNPAERALAWTKSEEAIGSKFIVE